MAKAIELFLRAWSIARFLRPRYNHRSESLPAASRVSTMRHCLSCLLATSCLFFLVHQPAISRPNEADEAKPELKEKVNQLVGQLADPDSEKQAAATAALLKLGPDILPLLPGPDAKLTDGQKRQLQTIAGTLRDAQAQRELTPKIVTLKEQSIALSQALKALKTQTGIKVADRRREQDSDPKLSLSLDKVTFWEALDEIAQRADLRVYLFDRDGVVSLVDGPHKALPVDYNGIFRIAVRRLTAVRDLESDSHVWTLDVQIAWEPRFRPLFLETQADAIEVRDGKGTVLNGLSSGSGRSAVTRPLSVETQVRVEAPERPADKIGLLKGSLNLMGPSRMLTFTFDDLDKIGRNKADKARKETQEGVTVHLREFSVAGERWTIGLLLEYPADTPDFESFESWLVNNEIFLEKKSTKERVPQNGGLETGDQAGHRAILIYRFVEDNNLVLGKPSDWRMIYRTPGTFVKLPVKFEFKDLPVP
jgi:hypothetical protein